MTHTPGGRDEPTPPDPGPPAVRGELTERLARIEALLLTPARGGLTGAEHRFEPAWRRATRGETRWASSAAVLLVAVVQLTLPARLSVQPRPLMPAVEVALLVCLVALSPYRIERRSPLYRGLGLVLTFTVGGANAYSVVRLVDGLVRGTEGGSAGRLLLTGGTVWLINMVIFGLGYWELDRGGPAARAHGERPAPDFLFVQMQSPELAPEHWEPAFLDYLYLSFTNSTAFSPTDVMPMTRTAKVWMLVQSAVSLITLVLVVARAVNILG
ncbi:hypothetical protein [Actinacidiphila sp. ITFR-21]|uniref:hypothetical protein n=1 Tax=Actinacidiphila sp. ITFR-21 TaxID=3075199 RepID=UPI00288AFA81|nr:hypothetical protein [Streptomyces sp. ITFR-21]WNI14585.1 hypothetical protein RLT57_02875 [Streptomyces sp. ITFR-21]